MKVLIIGFGSIGKRHFNLLSKEKKIKDLRVYTKQKINNLKTLKNKKDIIKFNPDYIVIANETNLHLKYLYFFEKNFSNKNILIEKPIFNKYKSFKVNKNKVFVGYNLRFNPLINEIKRFIKNKTIWSVSIITGSYLPNWRKGRSYKNSYSSKKNSGGVLLDLSHEIDYTLWLFGKFNPFFSISKKISNLKIKSDDFLSLIGKTKDDIYVQIILNYFFTIPSRQILIDGKNFSIRADLISNSMQIKYKNKIKKIYNKNFDINTTYINQHKEILNNKIKNTCTFNEGKEVMKIINNIKKNK